jgi:DNA repair exonuclease SbcCD ATPase subunit
MFHKKLFKITFLITIILNNIHASQEYKDYIVYGTGAFLTTSTLALGAIVAKLCNDIRMLKQQVNAKDLNQIKEQLIQEITLKMEAFNQERSFYKQHINECQLIMERIPDIEKALKNRIDSFDRQGQMKQVKEIEINAVGIVNKLKEESFLTISNIQQSYQSLANNLNNLQIASTNLSSKIDQQINQSYQIIKDLESSKDSAKNETSKLQKKINEIKKDMKTCTDKEIQRYNERTQSIYFATFEDLKQISNKIVEQKNDIYKYMQTLEKQLDKKLEKQQLEVMLKAITGTEQDIEKIKSNVEALQKGNKATKDNLAKLSALTKNIGDRVSKNECALSVIQNPAAYNYPQENPPVNPMED